MKNIHLPTAADSEPHTVEEKTDLSYGLNIRSTKKTEENKEDATAPVQRHVPAEARMLQKLKDDLLRLPEEPGFDEYKDVPVEGFGAALLARYGWKEGMGIGKNAKEDVNVKVFEIKKRSAKEGLWFV